ncbi:MAG TPA: PAS domain-containing protein [Rhizomicrobium sp.]|nr:PAS domain-containing protein [Rhizomicrobium sp.]
MSERGDLPTGMVQSSSDEAAAPPRAGDQPDAALAAQDWALPATPPSSEEELRLRLERLTLERLALATAIGRTGVWDYNIDTNSLYCDPRWYEIMGRDPANVVRSVEDFRPHIHPDDVERVIEGRIAKLSGMVDRKEDRNLVFRIIRPDGEIRWLSSAATLIEATATSPNRLVGFVNDVTETQLAEKRLQNSLMALQHAEASLRELNAQLEQRVAQRTRQRDRVWKNARDLIAVVGPDAVFQAANPAWADVLGWTPEELVGKSIFSVILPEDAALVAETFKAAIAGGNLTNFVTRVIHKDGSLRWISWHSSVEGDVIYGYGRDFTAEKHATDAGDKSVAQMRSIFETSYQHQGLLTPDGTLIDVNAMALQAIDLTREAALGQPLWQLPWFTGTPGMPEMIRSALLEAAAGQTQRREVEVDLPQTGRRWLDLTLRPICDPSGQIASIVWEAVDLTERRRAEDALRQGQKMEAVGQLTGGIAHDFNNLLQGIIGPLERVQQRLAEGLLEDTERFLSGAIASAKRAASLTQRLLAFSRRQTLVAKPLSMDLLVANMSELMAHTVGTAIVCVPSDEPLWQTVADANQLENVLLNLCINARDAMPDGGQITIATSNETLQEQAAASIDLAPGDYVCLRVSDTGSGMTPQTLGRVFDPFFTTKPLGKGTGLGLSMIYGFIKQSSGSIRITSQVNEGTSVHIYLPRFTGDPSAETAHDPLLQETDSGQGQSVLVVDDEPIIRMLICDVLEDAGYHVIEAHDGAGGLKALQTEPQVDLLITDVGLPGGMNGRQLADLARATRPTLHVLFITGYAEATVIGNAGLEPGMQILNKPFSVDELAATVKAMMDGLRTQG